MCDETQEDPFYLVRSIVECMVDIGEIEIAERIYSYIAMELST